MAELGDNAYGLLSGRLTEAVPEAMKATKEGFTKEEWLSLNVQGKPLYHDHKRLFVLLIYI